MAGRHVQARAIADEFPGWEAWQELDSGPGELAPINLRKVYRCPSDGRSRRYVRARSGAELSARLHSTAPESA